MDGSTEAQDVQVRAVRAEMVAMHRPHGRFVTDVQVAAVVARTGDVEIAAVAITLFPRPAWVEVLCGPMPDMELANAEDRAILGEWGGAGLDGT